MEGGNLTKAYVPMRDGQAIGNSGVTVSCGIDLGQSSIDQLQSMQISQYLIDLLTPYIGLTKDDAAQALENSPLIITEDQANELLQGEVNMRYASLESLYNKYSDNAQFGDLTCAQQTVCLDLAWQYGNNLPKACPHFWDAAVSQQWHNVITILQTFGDQYSYRRNAEADLLIQESS